MNRKPKIYLAGTKKEQHYREYVKKEYGHTLNFLDPFELVGQDNTPENLVRHDSDLIDESDMVVAYIMKPTFGTIMEIKYAHDSGKNVMLITDSKYNKDPWLIVHSKMFYDIDDCMINVLDNFGIHPNKEGDDNRNIHKCERLNKRKGEDKIMNSEEYTADNMGEEANKGFARDDSKTSTRLLDKQWSPLLVRKYYVSNWPCYVGLITDCNLNDLDIVVQKVIKEAEQHGFLDGNIQSCRNFCGFLSDKLDEHYDNIKKGSVEGIAVAWYVDKCFISSLSKDMMVHKSCRDEFYSILKILPHI